METEAMNYEVVLTWLRAKHAAVEKAIAGIEELRGLEAATDGGAPTRTLTSGMESGNVASDAFFSLNIADAARKYLTMVKKPQSAQQIADALKQGGFHTTSKNFTVTVYSVLARQEDLTRVKRGQWALIAWYPGLRRKGAPTNGKSPEPTESHEKE